MKIINKPLLKENKQHISENIKQARQYVQLGKLSEEDLKTIISIDPTSTKKYVGWLSKIWMSEKPDLDDLRNTIEEYNVFVEKGKAKTKDINQFKSFKHLKSEVDNINQSGDNLSVKDLEKDYDVVLDNEDVLIMSPHTHEASRKLGLTHFAFRDCDNGKDSAWCTTYKAPDHFNDYYYSNNVTFYYIKVKSQRIIEQLKNTFPKRYKQLGVVALAVLENGKMDGYDGLDKQMSKAEIEKYTQILGIS